MPPRFRVSIQSAAIRTSHVSKLNMYDISALYGSPSLQSLYMGTLRLHASNIILRSPSQDLNIRGWRIKPGEIISIMSYPMHPLNSSEEPTERDGEHISLPRIPRPTITGIRTFISGTGEKKWTQYQMIASRSEQDPMRSQILHRMTIDVDYA